MVEYNCFRCGYVASQKINLKNHLNRKNICKPTLEDISIEEIKNYYGFDTYSTILHQNPPKLHQNPPNLPIFHQNPPKSTKIHQIFHQNPPKSTKISFY